MAEDERAEWLPSLTTVGVAKVAGERRPRQVEGATRLHVDDAAQAALHLRGIRRLVHVDAAEQFGRNALERVAHAEIAFALREELETRQEDLVVQERHVL